MKALFIGLGGVGQRHLRHLLACAPDAQVAALRSQGRGFEIGDDLKPDYSVDIVEKYRIACLSDMDCALDWRPDLAVIANPSSLHVEAGLPLAAAGIPLLVEKPIASRHEDALALLAAAIQGGGPVLAAFTLRLHPAVRQAIAWVHQGRIGTISSASAICHNWLVENHCYEPLNHFYLGRRDLGGGSILSETHTVDLVHALFGLPRALWCRGGRLAELDIDVEDTATALLDYGFPLTLHSSMVEKPVERRLVVHGSGGRLVLDPLGGTATLSTEAGNEVFDASHVALRSLYADQMKHFLDVVARGSDAGSDLALAKVIGGQHIANAMLDSLERGQVVHF